MGTFPFILSENWLERSLRLVYSQKCRDFIEKRKTLFNFLIKISTQANFMRLWSKLTSEISESKAFRWGNDSKSAQDVHFFLFFLEKPLSLKKIEKRYFIFCYRKRNTCQFHAFAIKNDFVNMSEIGLFKFENSLNLTRSFNYILLQLHALFYYFQNIRDKFWRWNYTSF